MKESIILWANEDPFDNLASLLFQHQTQKLVFTIFNNQSFEEEFFQLDKEKALLMAFSINDLFFRGKSDVAKISP